MSRILLFFPSLLSFLLLLTNDRHHWLVLSFPVVGHVQPISGPVGWVLIGYGYLLAVSASLAFLWLFVRSPLHRWPAALCLVGQITPRVAYAFDRSSANPAAPMDPTILAFIFTASMYALAFLRFHMFDLLPIARGTAVAQMHQGMLILDARQRVLDLNPAAEHILGVAAGRARGRDLADVLPGYGMEKSEISVGEAGNARHYVVRQSALRDRRGLPLGSLILLGDVTEQRRVHAELLDQRGALATLRERDRVARELHDGLGQVLGYVKMQAQSARKLLAGGHASEADACLAQLATVAQDAHGDVREYIVGARTAPTDGAGLGPSLENYTRQFVEIYGIPVRLSVSPELAGRALDQTAEAQLLRIIQEALTNVRKHAGASGVNIHLAAPDGLAEAVVEDDGVGFRPELLDTARGRRFGLLLMRERAEEVGGTMQIHSAPGQGTRVVIQVPLRKGRS